MRIHINGRYEKLDHQWCVELPALSIRVSAETPFQAFKELIETIEKEMAEAVNCEVIVHDQGVFELTTMNREAVYSYIAKTVDSAEGLDEILKSIKLKPDLEGGES